MEPVEAVTRNLEHTFPRTGTYQVKLDATDAYGSSGSVTRQIGVVDGKLIASFQCQRVGGRYVTRLECGQCRCTSVDETRNICLTRQPSDCSRYDYVSGQAGPGCNFPITEYFEDFSCSDRSSGGPDVFDWLVPGLIWQGSDPKKSGRSIHFTMQAIPGVPYKIWVHHTVLRLADGLSSSAIAEIPAQGGTASALRADFSWSPGFPRVDDEVVFEQKADGASTFEWLVDGKLQFTGPSFKYKFQESGRHEISLRVGNSAVTNSRIKIIEVGPKATPAFTKVASRWGQCFFSTVPLQTEIEATLNWGGTPAQGSYRINDGPANSIDVSGDTFSFPINSQDLLFSEFRGNQRSNVITIAAKNAVGDEAKINFRLDTYNTSGSWLNNVQKTVQEEGRYTITNLSNIPQPEWEGQVVFPSVIPFIGGKSFGLKKTQASLETSFRTDCTASESIKGQTGFQAGPGIITGAIYGKGELQMSPNGITAVKETLGFEIAGAIEPEPIPILSAVPAAAAMCGVPALAPFCDILKVKSEFKLAAGAEFDFARPKGEPEFLDGRGILTPSVKVGLTGELGPGTSFDVWGGGQAAFTIHPVPPILRKVEAALETGMAVNFYIWQVESKMAVVCEWDSTSGWKPCIGPSSVLAGTSAPLALRARPVHGQPEYASRRLRMRGESVVLESLSPLAAPAAAASGDEIMAVYLSEDVNASNELQRTNLRYTTRQNGAWSESNALNADAFGDFAPTLIGASEGRFIAIWQRVKNAALRLEDVPTLTTCRSSIARWRS